VIDIRVFAMIIPVVLFTYNRLDVLVKTIDCLRNNSIPLVVVYSDAAKSAQDESGVNAVREYLSKIDWCTIERHDRERNLGLGRNILSGITETLQQYEAVLVWEDDLICVPGTYQYLCSALEQYRNDDRVMSVTGWTNRHVTPDGVGAEPYFDGRAECWVWGTWRRAWQGMIDETAIDKMEDFKARGGSPYHYGGDLPYMAKHEMDRNIWAVRFLFHHILHHGLCLRPPWSMVEHIGFDARATNAVGANWLVNGELKDCPPIPTTWPLPVENGQCAGLHREMCPRPWSDLFPSAVKMLRFLQNSMRHKQYGV
jgi:hypothetical protein